MIAGSYRSLKFYIVGEAVITENYFIVIWRGGAGWGEIIQGWEDSSETIQQLWRVGQFCQTFKKLGHPVIVIPPLSSHPSYLDLDN